MEKWNGRVSLALKLNILIIAAVLITTLGLITVSAHAYTRTIRTVYTDEAVELMNRILGHMDPDEIANLWAEIDSDEYREVHERAVEKDDVRILQTWLRSRPSLFADARQFDTESPNESLYSDYLELYFYLSSAKRYSSAESLFLQYEKDGLAYVICDPDLDVRALGTPIGDVEEEDVFGYNEIKDGQIYREQVIDYWYFLKGAQIGNKTESGEIDPVCTVIALYDVNTIMQGRQRFILYCLIVAVGLIATVIAASTFLVRRSIADPLKSLAKGTVEFGRGENGYTRDSIISMDIRSDDEIGDLYTEIRSMQERILDYTDNLEQITAERERAESEMRTAAGIQEAMLPHNHSALSERPEFDLSAVMDPAKEVGGDFYDYFMIDDDHLAILIADVSEKGVPAALFMMASKILLDYRSKLGGSPREILEAVNEEISANNASKMFITVWIGILDIRTGHMVCSNAGHEYPEIRGRDGHFRMLKDEHGLVMGIKQGTAYTDYELTLSAGDAVFVYTDGVTDAKNAAGEFYGIERAEAVLNEKSLDSAEEIIGAVREDMARFSEGAVQFDDITMLCLIYRGGTGETPVDA